MDEAAIIKALGGTVGAVLTTIGLRFAYTNWQKQNPSIQQAGAEADIYAMLKEQSREQQLEIRLLKKQVHLLESLCLANGIDVSAMYEKHNILGHPHE